MSMCDSIWRCGSEQGWWGRGWRWQRACGCPSGASILTNDPIGHWNILSGMSSIRWGAREVRTRLDEVLGTVWVNAWHFGHLYEHSSFFIASCCAGYLALHQSSLSLSLFLYLLPLLTRGGSGCAAVCVNTPVCVRVFECATPNERPPSGAHHGEWQISKVPMDICNRTAKCPMPATVDGGHSCSTVI